MCVLCPKYLNIRRGCILAAIISAWVMVPWKILSSASTFLAFMGGYAVFLAPMSGIMAADYWIVKKRHIDVPGLYDPHGRYRYWNGVNWQGLVAFVVPVAPLLPGLARSIDGVAISEGAQNLYTIDWLFGFLVSGLLYSLLSLVFPHREALISHTIYSLDVVEGMAVDAERDLEAESRGVHEGAEKGFGNVDAVDLGKHA